MRGADGLAGGYACGLRNRSFFVSMDFRCFHGHLLTKQEGTLPALKYPNPPFQPHLRGTVVLTGGARAPAFARPPPEQRGAR